MDDQAIISILGALLVYASAAAVIFYEDRSRLSKIIDRLNAELLKRLDEKDV